MSSGKEPGLSKVYLTKSSAADFEQLCSLDVLGLKDSQESDQGSLYDEFLKQLDRSKKGWYESGLLWKPGHGRLLTNEHGSIARLEGLVTKLQQEPGMIDKYDEIIYKQSKEGVVERVVQEPNGRVFYIPHTTSEKGNINNEKTQNCI